MGGYSPTIGIIGAVMGLIHVMRNLADPAPLGPGIALAFVATIYGEAVANLFLLPVANKLKMGIVERSRHRELIIEGRIATADGEHPRSIGMQLTGYLQEAGPWRVANPSKYMLITSAGWFPTRTLLPYCLRFLW